MMIFSFRFSFYADWQQTQELIRSKCENICTKVEKNELNQTQQLPN